LSGVETTAGQKRRRYTVPERQQLVAAWKSSGMSAAAFGQLHGVHTSNLWRWTKQPGRKPGRRRTRMSRDFIELRPAAKPDVVEQLADTHAARVEVACPNGMRIRIFQDVDVAALAALVEVMGGRQRC
jgi:transposase-like protein